MGEMISKKSDTQRRYELNYLGKEKRSSKKAEVRRNSEKSKRIFGKEAQRRRNQW